MQIMPSRRDFLAGASLAAAAGVFGGRGSLAAEGPPETTTIRLKKTLAICFAPLYVVEALLHAEGFTDVRYLTTAGGLAGVKMVEQGDLDFEVAFAGQIVHQLDSGRRSRRWADCMWVATSCSRASRFAPSAT